MIRLGYEIGTGHAVDIPLRHTAVTGQTQESGKTTTLEAVITRSGLRAVAFVTKRGEKSFRLQTSIPPYFREPVLAPETPMWRWVESIFETIGESVGKEEKAAIIQASDQVLEIEHYKAKGETKRRLAETHIKVSTLEEVHGNVLLMMDTARGGFKRALICLKAYFQIVLPQIVKMQGSRRLDLARGLNVMDLEGLTDEMQMLVIRSVIETVYREMKNVVVIVPEAAKFIPRMRKSPVRFVAEMFIRQGLGIGNVLMLDSQDLANVATEVLKSVGVWILGKQSEINEVKRVVDYIPQRPKIAQEAIMQLGRGEFYVVAEGRVRKCYVQPAGMEDVHAQAIARGEETAASWGQIVKRLDRAPHQLLQIQEQERTDGGESVAAGEGVGADGEVSAARPGSGGEVDAGAAAGFPADVERSEGVSGGESEEVSDARMSAKNPGRAMVEDGRGLRPDSERHEDHGSVRGDVGGDHCADYSIEAEEEMEWKERAQNAEAEVIKLRHEVQRLSNALLAHGVGIKRPDGAADSTPSSPAGNGSRVESVGIAGFTDAGYELLRARLLADPGVLAALESSRPELMVNITRQRLSIDGDTTTGRVARLIHEGFFSSPTSSANILREFKARGWIREKAGYAELIKPMKEITEMGFLRVEGGNYQAVPGMKVTVSG